MGTVGAWSAARGHRVPGHAPALRAPRGDDVQLPSRSRRALGLLTAGTIGAATAVIGAPGIASAAVPAWSASGSGSTTAVPAGICGVRWTVIGGGGGLGSDGSPGGGAGRIVVVTPVEAGDVFVLHPGGCGTDADGDTLTPGTGGKTTPNGGKVGGGARAAGGSTAGWGGGGRPGRGGGGAGRFVVVTPVEAGPVVALHPRTRAAEADGDTLTPAPGGATPATDVTVAGGDGTADSSTAGGGGGAASVVERAGETFVQTPGSPGGGELGGSAGGGYDGNRAIGAGEFDV